MNKFEIKKVLSEYFFIVLGSFILALGVNIFMLPNKISAGGVSSLGTMLLYVFGIKLSVTSLVCNCILFFFGYKNLGKKAVIKTILGIFLFSFFIELTESFRGYTDNQMIAAISGGALMGLGVGMTTRQGASTGGSDFAGMILKKALPYVPLARLIMLIDLVIVIVSGLVFKSFTVTFYSLVGLYISYLLTDKVLTWGEDAKMVGIFSKETEKIAKYILDNYERGVTGVRCVGMYTKKESYMLMCVVSSKQISNYLNLVKSFDKDAFVIIGDVHEVWGEGFKTLY